MDGLEVQEALQAKGVTLPVIIMTGHGDVPLAVKAMKAGAVDFIEKPFEKAVLLARYRGGLRAGSNNPAGQCPREEARPRLKALHAARDGGARRTGAGPSQQDDRL